MQFLRLNMGARVLSLLHSLALPNNLKAQLASHHVPALADNVCTKHSHSSACSPVLSSTCVSILAPLTPITGFSSSPQERHTNPGVEPSPCFSNFLARTTFVLESLPEVKNPGQDAFWGILS